MAPLHNNGRRSRGSHASRIGSANCVIEIPCRKQVICLSAPVRFPAPGLAGRAARTAMVKIGQYFGTKRENENFPCTSRVVSLAVDMGARPRLGVTSLNRPLCASFNLSDLSVRWGQTRQHSNSRSVDFRKPFAAATRFTKMHARTACSPRGGEFRDGSRPSNALATAIFERSPAHCGTSRIVFFGPGSTRAF